MRDNNPHFCFTFHCQSLLFSSTDSLLETTIMRGLQKRYKARKRCVRRTVWFGVMFIRLYLSLSLVAKKHKLKNRGSSKSFSKRVDDMRYY